MIYGRWSEIVAVRFPETESGLRILGKISSVSVLELLLILVGCKIYSKYLWDKKGPRNSLVAVWWSYLNKFTLKSPSRKTDLVFSEILFSKGLKRQSLNLSI